MNENEAREKIVATARAFLGAKQGSAAHKKLIDTFNKIKPDGWAMTYTAPWCATAASAWSILAFGEKMAIKYFPLSANCGTIITKAKQLKIFKEADSYVPKRGDWILYDWQDSGKGDNTGSPDHVGVVERVSKNTITVIEGNKHQVVAERSVAVNGRYIRGFVVPKYADLAKDLTPKKEKKVAKKPTGKQMVDLARKQLGNGYKKYCKAFGKNTSWCQIFMWWLFHQKKMTYLKDSFARHAAKWAKEHWPHVSFKEAKAGDVIYFSSKGKNHNNKMTGTVTHVGIVRKAPYQKTDAKGKKYWVVPTIEGNVNGGGNWKKSVVAIKTRNQSYVWGIFRPPYASK